MFEKAKLKKHSWHRSLQNFVWFMKDYDRPYSIEHNFCPYFWLTIASIIVLPFSLFLIRPFWLLKKLNTFIKKYINEKFYLPALEKNTAELTHREIVILYGIFEYLDTFDYTYYLYYFYPFPNKEFNLSKSQFEHKKTLWQNYKKTLSVKELPDLSAEWQPIYDEIKEIINKLEIQRRNQRDKRKLFLNKIAANTKFVAYGLAFILAAFLLYYLALGIMAITPIIVSSFLWMFSGVGLSFIGTLLSWTAVVLILLLFVLWISSLIKLKLKLNNPFAGFSEKSGKIIDKILSPFGLFIEYIKNFKENHCPEIEWID